MSVRIWISQSEYNRTFREEKDSFHTKEYVSIEEYNQLLEEHQKILALRRMVVDETDEGLYICRGDHEKCDPCDYELYIPASAASAVLSQQSFTELMGYIENPPKPTPYLRELYQKYLDNKAKSKKT